jgi:hypothetical protein
MREKYEPIIKDGTHLAESHKTEGAYRGILLDDETNQLAGQAEWKRVKKNKGNIDADICTIALAVTISVVMTLIMVRIIRMFEK